MNGQVAETTKADRFLRIGEVERTTGLKRGYIRLLVRHDAFPRQIRLSHKMSVWSQNEVAAWMAAKTTEARVA